MSKKEDVFYTMLKQVAYEMVSAAEEYASIMRDFPASMARIPRMKVHETTTDELVATIHQHLYTSFITPFDREDISDLALRMDDVVDLMEVVSMRLDLFGMDVMRPEAVEMAELTLRAVEELREVVERLPRYAKDDQIMLHAIAVSRIEDGADRVYQNALRRLFSEEVHGKEVVTWLRIFDRMENCLNACDKAAGVVRSVIMKSS
jgi:predicted phosphate transport protein (TIGR00153 family)